MKAKIFSIALLAIGSVLFSCVAETILPEAKPEEREAMAEVKPAWEVEWEKTLSVAKKEGTVVVFATFGATARNALVEAFTKKYGFPLEMVVGRGASMSNKIITEKRAGLHTVDVFLGGSTNMILDLKPAGLLAPIRPALLLPEVTDPNLWWEKRLPITVDKEQMYIFSYGAQVSIASMVINTDHVTKAEFQSYYDLLKPKYKRNIVWTDPTRPGSSLKWFGVVLTAGTLDANYMKELAKQEPIFTDNERMGVEWVARGKHLVGMHLTSEVIREFREVGFPMDDDVILKEDVPRIVAAGGGNLVLLNNAPHPNAARVFINWLLSKEGSTIKALASGHGSARADVPMDHLLPEKRWKPNVKYFDTENEEFLKKQEQHARLAQEIFGHLLR